jgi:hypothetical protein
VKRSCLACEKILNFETLSLIESAENGTYGCYRHWQVPKSYIIFNRREFAMGITSLSDSIGVSLAGATALVLERMMLRHLGVASAHC